MHFITSAYGNSYSPLLMVFLRSVQKNSPVSTVTVYWQSIDDDIMNSLKKVFQKVVFIQTFYNIDGGIHQIISSKMNLWCQALEETTESEVCLIDSDTVVSHSPEGLLNDYDCIFTDKNEQFQLNTGVVLVKKSQAVLDFFRLWKERTNQIINTPALLQVAVNPANHYGGADQMSLYQLVTYTPSCKKYSFLTQTGGEIKLKAVACSILNQTNSIPLSPDIYIYHYKGGWRDILFHGRYSRYRKRKDCLQMLLQYLELYRECINIMYDEFIDRKIIKKIKLHIPKCFDMKNGLFLSKWYKVEMMKDIFNFRSWLVINL